MQPQDRRFRHIVEQGPVPGYLGSEFRHLRLRRRVIHAVFDGREDARDLLLNLLQCAFGILLRAAAIARGGVERLSVFLDEGRDQIGVQEFPLKTVEHPGLQMERITSGIAAAREGKVIPVDEVFAGIAAKRGCVG